MAVKVIEESRISPPQHSTPPETSLPLTFFDVFWIIMPPVKRLFFYEFHHSNQHFIETVLPHMKHSLSQALQLFYPFAGHLITDPDDHHDSVPEIACSHGDSITLTVAETDSDFKHLSGHHARDVSDFFPLVPKLDSQLLALQVTLFPNSGIAVGITNSHVVADGKITTHFVKYWASLCKLGTENPLVPLISESSVFPFFDRSVVNDPKGLDKLYLKQIRELEELIKSNQVADALTPIAPTDIVVRATFVLGSVEIEKLKQWVTSKMKSRLSLSSSDTAFHVSTFVIVCAYVWVCWTKCKSRGDNEDGERLFFAFGGDFRGRLDPPLPKFYFGNCIIGVAAEANKRDIIGEDGMVVAAELIGRHIQELNKQSKMEGGETYISNISSVFRSGAKVLSVAGSPKFKVYETDFGWGRPRKVEVVSIEDSGAISLSESRDDENGGVEVGLVLSKLEMDCFASQFQQTLKGVTD
ncbi:hypothetical protein Syun_024601 [Stephania yunnanensis]|uniref:Uncharacterized protein n=1 Tax=Stephania yunnanensis TaxID=152371 RepID=A0AAP0I4N8_9MAGN